MQVKIGFFARSRAGSKEEIRRSRGGRGVGSVRDVDGIGGVVGYRTILPASR